MSKLLGIFTSVVAMIMILAGTYFGLYEQYGKACFYLLVALVVTRAEEEIGK